MPHAPAPALLEARALTAELSGDTGILRVLDGVSLSLLPGEIVDVTGPSGAGKTTLLRALARLLPNATGELSLNGIPAADIAPQVWRTTVALLPQKPALVAGDVLANLLLPWRLKVRRHLQLPAADDLREAMDAIELGDVALERDVARLSVGQQARIALLRSLLSGPDVLLLDEPDAALDPSSAAAVLLRLRAFAEEGGAIVRVRHREGDGLAGCRLLLAEGVLGEVNP